MTFLTNEFQYAYKVGRSTIDVLSLLNNQIKNDGTENLILFDLSKAFDTINREILWAVLYEQGLPINLIRIIKLGNKGTCLRAKNNGKVGNKTENNKGVFQGSPLSAFLFIIYDERMMQDYVNNLNNDTRANMNETTIRDEIEENKWTIYI